MQDCAVSGIDDYYFSPFPTMRGIQRALRASRSRTRIRDAPTVAAKTPGDSDL